MNGTDPSILLFGRRYFLARSLTKSFRVSAELYQVLHRPAHGRQLETLQQVLQDKRVFCTRTYHAPTLAHCYSW